MKNVIIFPALVVSNKPKYYPASNSVEFMAQDADDPRRRPSAFKLTNQGDFAKQFPEKFKIGDIINVKAIAEAYRGKIYGRLGRPIKYPDGSFRYTSRVRFHVISIRKGTLDGVL